MSWVAISMISFLRDLRIWLPLLRQLRIERGGRLVEQEHTRPHGERPGNCHTLLLAAGKFRGIGARLGLQAHLIQQVERQRGSFAFDALKLTCTGPLITVL